LTDRSHENKESSDRHTDFMIKNVKIQYSHQRLYEKNGFAKLSKNLARSENNF